MPVRGRGRRGPAGLQRLQLRLPGRGHRRQRGRRVRVAGLHRDRGRGARTGRGLPRPRADDRRTGGARPAAAAPAVRGGTHPGPDRRAARSVPDARFPAAVAYAQAAQGGSAGHCVTHVTKNGGWSPGCGVLAGE
ncbi:hypothetical protein SGPA1_10141 [Streptomyces misionensis JCM 4497]